MSVDLLSWMLCIIGPAADAVLAAGVHRAIPGPDLGRIVLDKKIYLHILINSHFLRNDIDS